MPDYRRYFVPGGTYFLTLVSYGHRFLFARPTDIQRLREAIASVQREGPFRFLAGVVLFSTTFTTRPRAPASAG